MATKRTREEDKVALEKKVLETAKGGPPAKPEELEGLRRLHKRLKRVQRKIQGKAARIAMASGTKKPKAA